MGPSLSLLDSSQANLFTIDSSTPYLWLPEAVCSQFEDTFNLTYDEVLQLYTFAPNGTSHDTLANWNMTFHFQVADLPGSSNAITLSLPYDAFDLQLTYPNPGLIERLNRTDDIPTIDYFPLRKAANSTQFTIGRAFLQETYLKVDYERNNFSIHQATFDIDPANNMQLVDIPRLSNSTLQGPPASSDHKFNKGAIAGLVVGGSSLLVFSILAIMCCVRRRGYRRKGYVKEKEPREPRGSRLKFRFLQWFGGGPEREMPAEIGGSQRFALEAPEGRSFKELPTSNDGGSSMSGSELSGVDMFKHGKAINAIGHDPDKPVELPYRMSNRLLGPDEFAARDDGRDLFESAEPPTIRFKHPAGRNPFTNARPAPPLSRQDTFATHQTGGISSPSSSEQERNGDGSSPVYVVSPVTPNTEQGQYSSLLSIARRTAWYITNDEADPTGTNTTQRSEESGVSGVSGESGISPEDSISQGEVSRRSTVSPIEDLPGRGRTVPTIAEQTEPEDEPYKQASETTMKPSRRSSNQPPPITPTTMRTSANTLAPPPLHSHPQIHADPHDPSTSNPISTLVTAHAPAPTTSTNDAVVAPGTAITRDIRNSIQRGYSVLSYPATTPSQTPNPMTTTITIERNNTTGSASAPTWTSAVTPTPPMPTLPAFGAGTARELRLSTATAMATTEAGTGTGTGTGMGTGTTYSPARWIEFWRTGRDPRDPRNRSVSAGGDMHVQQQQQQQRKSGHGRSAR